MNYYERQDCRSCGSDLRDIMSLGDQKIVEWSKTGKAPARVPLDLVYCDDCSLLQLRHTTAPELLWNENYGYRSGINQTMREHHAGIVQSVQREVCLKPGDVVVDIGCNDGTLLSNYPKGVTRIGFEPSRNVAEYAWKDGNVDKLFLEFFNANPFVREYGEHKAKVITAISMFYDLDNPNKFVSDVKRCLTRDGVFVVQQNYVGGMLEQNAVDNICHEHVEYYSLTSMQNLLGRHDMEVYKVEQNDLNGGSFRTYICNKGERPLDKSVCNLQKEERDKGLYSNGIYDRFAARSRVNAEKLHNFVEAQTAEGKLVYVYGASTRGNTLMQFANLEGLIPKAAERNPDKWGGEYNGAIMVSEEEARADNPDFFLVLPWFFKKEFVEREKDFRAKGGKLIFPLPEMQVL